MMTVNNLIPSGTKRAQQVVDEEFNQSPLSVTKSSKVSQEDIDWLKSSQTSEDFKLCCLISGKDGQGKSGLALDYLSDEEIKAGMKMVIIDVDGGMEPLLWTYHKQRVEKLDKKLSDVYIIKNPLETSIQDGEFETDYKATFQNIVKIIAIVREKSKEWNVKCIVLDGLSTLLRYAERQMRLDRHVAPDGGVQMRYWLIRNQIFENTIEQIKTIPVSKIFISHEDFISTKDNLEMSSVKARFNAGMFQKIRCIRETQNDGKVTFSAVIDKSKLGVKAENKKITFCEVNSKLGKYVWKASEVWECI